MVSSADSTALSATPPTAAARVGADLRSARLRLGWSLEDLAAALRIRQPYLQALEQGDVAALPGPAYAVGFLRTYGHALGLNADELSRRFRSEAEAATPRTELAFPAPVPERGVPAGAVVLVGVVLAIGAYVGWYRLSGEGRLPPEVTPPVPARLAPLAEQALPPPAPAAALPAHTGTETAQATVPHPVAAGASVPPGAAAAMSMPAPTPPILQPPPAPAPVATVPATPTPPAAANPDGARIVIRAKADAWVQVREPGNGHPLLSRMLRAGETWPVPPNKPGLLMTLGNAGGTEILVDGVAAPGFGLSGAVRRDLPLDPEMIRDGKLPGQQAAATGPDAVQPAAAHQSAGHGPAAATAQ